MSTVVETKWAAANKRFGASGVATRPTLCVGQLLSALVRAVAMPPPAAKPPDVIGKRGDNAVGG